MTWNAVGYFEAHADKVNTFQLVIINRGDRAVNDFDFEFNYNQIRWEVGDANDGSSGLCESATPQPAPQSSDTPTD